METIAKKCSCGAITLMTDQGNWSMPEKTFNKEFPMIDLEKDEFGNCDYCVNHWGIDLCGCGSGQKVGHCDENYYECRHNIPAQTLGTAKEYALWK